MSRAIVSDLKPASTKRARIALMGNDDLATVLVRALARRGVRAAVVDLASDRPDQADLLVQLDDRIAPDRAIDAALAMAPELGAERIVVLRQGVPLADRPMTESTVKSDLPISIVHLPTILTVPRRSAQGLARRALAAIWPVVFAADVADVLARHAGDAGPQARPTDRAGSAVHALIMRCADILVGLSIVTLALPILLGLAVAIRRDSPGPAIFRQRRVGRGEIPFTLFKFRTMALGTRQAGTHEVTSRSVTRLGGKLRHYKLDELPQAWNLLVGNLTLVGPRPCLVEQTELIEERRRRGVFAIKPGLTGLAQVRGIDMSDPVYLAEIDEAYAAVRGIALDLALIARTFAGGGSGDRVAVAPPGE